jgi:NADH-quinone oxidoreductase subunit C
MEEKDVLKALAGAFPGGVLEAGESFGDPVARVRPDILPSAAAFLKAAPWSFTMLLDETCVDYPDRPERFEMVYHFYSLASNRRLRLKAGLSADHPEIGSLAGLWKNADWLEREVFDMFGVRFSGHPDLRRLLMYDGFEGHPLRKDYPLRGRQPLFDKRGDR